MNHKMKIYISKIIYRVINKISSLYTLYQTSQFAECGKNVCVGKHCDFIPSHIHIGNHVHIGAHASFMASIAHIYIRDHVMFGPHVTIRGGDHRIDIIGRNMIDVKECEKLPENDADVVIEEDCWIGCNVTILKGVTIGRGCVVAAGAVVTKSCAPYSIVAGIPGRVLHSRFSLVEILAHETKLYPQDKRYSTEELLAFGIQ